MKKITLIVLALALSACSSPSVEDLMDDPKLLVKIMEKCEKLNAQDKNIDTDECNNAIAATKRIVISGAEDTFNKAKKNSKLLLDDIQKKSPEALEDFEKSAKKALGNSKEGVDELYEKAKKLLEE